MTELTTNLPNNWVPRDDQRPLWYYLQKGGKRAVVVAHRRWGKDDCALHYTATQAIQRPGNYWYMLPKYEQARKVIWTAINPRTGVKRIDEAFPESIRVKTNESEMKIETISISKDKETGEEKSDTALWQLVGSDNYNQYVGSPPIGVVISEYALANPMALAYLLPILEENNGWIILLFTPRGNNHGKIVYVKAQNDPEWFSMLVTAEQSGVFNNSQLKKIKKDYLDLYGVELGEALFNQEYFCSFDSAQLGAYYAKQLSVARKEGRIGRYHCDASYEVYTAWDLGVDDSTTIWFFQVIGNCFYFIDYYESVGEGMEHYIKLMKSKKYDYGDHYMPHDADARRLGERAESPREVMERHGIQPIEIVQRPKDSMAVLRGIGTARNILSRCHFDEKACNQGLIALESYRAEYDETKKKLQNSPKHDWSSHGADAFRTFAVGYLPKTNTMSVTDMMNRR